MLLHPTQLSSTEMAHIPLFGSRISLTVRSLIKELVVVMTKTHILILEEIVHTMLMEDLISSALLFWLRVLLNLMMPQNLRIIHHMLLLLILLNSKEMVSTLQFGLKTLLIAKSLTMELEVVLIKILTHIQEVIPHMMLTADQINLDLLFWPKEDIIPTVNLMILLMLLVHGEVHGSQITTMVLVLDLMNLSK